MSGYADYSMSNNAVAAYDLGLLPASKAAKDLKVNTEAIERWLSPSEWHHTSAKFNVTNFYDISDLLNAATATPEQLADPEWLDEFGEALQTLKKMREFTKTCKAESGKVYTNCTVEWLEWPYAPGCGGRWADKKPDECKAEGCTVIVKGKTATVIFADGRKMTKRLSTAGFEFKQTKQTPNALVVVSTQDTGQL